MRWSERQRAMLAEMGIRLWEREGSEAAVVDGEPPMPSLSPSPAPAALHSRSTPSAPSVSMQRADAADIDLPAADWLIVGEPIDATQAQLLDNMLRAIGARRGGSGRQGRAALYALPEKTSTGRDPSLDARLRAAVETVQPCCIVAFGRAAAHALLSSDEPLGSLRGTVHEALGVPVVVSCSLAFLLRHGDEKARAWADLCLAVRAADGAAPTD